MNEQFEYLEYLYKRIYDTGNPKLDLGLQKVSSWHVNALNEDLDGQRLMHLRKVRKLFKKRLDIARSTLKAEDQFLQYLKENIALSGESFTYIQTQVRNALCSNAPIRGKPSSQVELVFTPSQRTLK